MKVLLDSRHAAPVLRAVEPSVRRRLKAGLKALAQDPSGQSTRLDVKRLEVDEDGPVMYRLRVGDWRIAFTVEPAGLVVLRIFPRSEGYGWLEKLG